jgi:uncharacterized protein with PIN domain
MTLDVFGVARRCSVADNIWTGAKMLSEMPSQEAEMCILCEQARVIEQKRQIAFRQRTDKGDVSCRVAVQFNVCPQCGFEYWDDRAETALDEAVRDAYEKLA